MFAFAANTVTSGVQEGVEKNPTFAAFIERAGHEYAEHSATPKEYDAFVDQISKMWADQPNWTDAQLKAIDTPILVVDGDHDEAIKREHTEYIAATIPARRPPDPAEREPLRLPAGPRRMFNFAHPAFPRRRVTTRPRAHSKDLRSPVGRYFALRAARSSSVSTSSHRPVRAENLRLELTTAESGPNKVYGL